MLERLRRELPGLDDIGRDLILASGFRVACADGEIEVEKDQQHRAIAGALAINEGLLDLKTATAVGLRHVQRLESQGGTSTKLARIC